MAALTLYIDTSANQLCAALNQSKPVDHRSLPFFFGDTLSLRIYLFVPVQQQDPSIFPFSIVPLAGLALFFYLTDGTVDDGSGDSIYTQKVDWDVDANNTFFSGDLPLNDPKLAALLAGADGADCWLKIGYLQNGKPTTVLSKKIHVQVGIPNVVLEVAAGLTPLSAEVANQTYVKREPDPGQPIYLYSPAGKKFALQAVDNEDGTASVVCPQVL